MIMKRYLNKFVLILFFTISIKAYAHKDIVIKKRIGKVEFVFKTFDYYEEINKCLIISKYVNKLIVKKGYKGKVILFFSHIYIDTVHIKEKYEWNINNDGLTFLLKDEKYDITNTLMFIENVINKAQNKNDSKSIVGQILKEKIYRPKILKEFDYSNKYSYYVQNGNICVYKLKKNTEVVFDEVKNIFQFKPLKNCLIYFTSKNIFKLTCKDEIYVYNLSQIDDILSVFKIKFISPEIIFLRNKTDDIEINYFLNIKTNKLYHLDKCTNFVMPNEVKSIKK